MFGRKSLPLRFMLAILALVSLVPTALLLTAWTKGRGEMASDLGELALAFYFSSFILVFIPALGLAVGALAGKLTPGVSVTLGSLVGLASGVAGLVLTFGFFWVLPELGDRSPARELSLIIALGLPLSGALAPVVIAQLVRLRRDCWS